MFAPVALSSPFARVFLVCFINKVHVLTIYMKGVALESIFRMFKSIDDLEKNIEKTRLTIESFISCYVSTLAFGEYFLKRDPKTFDKDDTGRLLKKHIDHAKVSEEDLYEMGFIKLFGDLESFMYEFLVEIYTKYPKSIGEDKKIEAQKIIRLDTIEEVKKAVIDEMAVSDSYSMENWTVILKNKFNILTFSDKRTEELFLILNEVRNAILHSNGKASTKTIQKMSKLKSGPPKHGEKMDLNRKDLFKWTFGGIKNILENIKKSSKDE